MNDQVPEAIARLYRHRGRWCSVYLDVSASDESQAERLNVERKHVLEALAADGADDAMVERVRSVLTGPGWGRWRSGDTLVVLTADDGTLFERLLPEPPRRDVARVGPLPYAAPLVEWHHSVIPHVVAVCDREGADIVAFDGGEPVGGTTVEGDTEHIHRSHPGGWSQRRFQQRAEETWERNAAGVANEVATVAGDIGARALFAAGDERALGFLRSHLPTRWREQLRVVGGNVRGEPDALDAVADEIVRENATIVAERTVGLLDRFAEARTHDGAVEGSEPTLAALAAGRVATLLVHDDPDDERTAWCGPEPASVGVTSDAVPGGSAVAARLVDVAIRGAIGTGGGVRIIPAHGPSVPADRIGALLRY